MGRFFRGACAGLLLVGCVPSYSERVGAANAAPAPEPTATTTSPAPVEAVASQPAVPEALPPKQEVAQQPKGIDVDWTYFAGKAADKQLAPLGGPEVQDQLGPWKCTISKQDTTTEGSAPMERKRGIHCKHWGSAVVATSVTCDLDRRSNDVELNLDDYVVAVACKAK